MISVSLCMIVKNEENVLARCLDSIADLVDEIVIIDTGSTDKTKEIAAKYTSKVFDFTWIDDFAAARNFSFSKATKDYIYTADADEVLDETNRERFRQLKEVLHPEVEIVQMKYVTETTIDAIQNVKKEYRPKLFKRVRNFVWVEPVHETVRLDPLVFDSDVEVFHRPEGMHGHRDFDIFLKKSREPGGLSDRLFSMYTRELFKLGNTKDFQDAEDIYLELWQQDPLSRRGREAGCMLARLARLENDAMSMMKYATRDMMEDPSSEMCYDLGMLYVKQLDYDEAIVWFLNAAYETRPIIDIHTHGDSALSGLVTCYVMLLDMEMNKGDQADGAKIDYYNEAIDRYQRELDAWELPEEL